VLNSFADICGNVSVLTFSRNISIILGHYFPTLIAKQVAISAYNQFYFFLCIKRVDRGWPLEHESDISDFLSTILRTVRKKSLVALSLTGLALLANYMNTIS